MGFRQRTRRRMLVALVALGASTTGALACVTVLGLDDFVPDLDDGGTTSVSSTGTGGGGSCSGAHLLAELSLMLFSDRSDPAYRLGW